MSQFFNLESTNDINVTGDKICRWKSGEANYWAALSRGIVYYAVQLILWKKPQFVTTPLKAIEQYLNEMLFVFPTEKNDSTNRFL